MDLADGTKLIGMRSPNVPALWPSDAWQVFMMVGKAWLVTWLFFHAERCIFTT